MNGICTAKLILFPLQAKAPSKLSSAFSGTQDKCAACQKTVYPLEKVQECCSATDKAAHDIRLSTDLLTKKKSNLPDQIRTANNVNALDLLVQMTLEGESYHKSCFKCSHGGCILTTSSYAALNGILYCKIHFSQLFKEKGSYNHLIQTAQKKNESAEAALEPAADAGAAE